MSKLADKLLVIINDILEDNDKEVLGELVGSLSLRNDLGFDSLNLAELTVKIEDEFDVDIFEDGIVDQLSEIMTKINEG